MVAGGLDTSQLTTIANNGNILIQALGDLAAAIEEGLDLFDAANKQLSNLGTTAVNASIVPGQDATINLGSLLLRWALITAERLGTGSTATQTLKLSAYSTSLTDFVDFLTLTAGNTPTCAIANSSVSNATITGGTINNTVIGGSTPAAGSFTNVTTPTVDLGNTDTTLSRAEAGVIAVEGTPVYSNMPVNSQSAAYTLVLSDAQKFIYHPSSDNNARTFTIPANSSVAYPVGTAVTFVNCVNTVTIAINSDTLTLAGAGTTGSRTLAANGMATAIKTNTTEWMISGVGLT